MEYGRYRLRCIHALVSLTQPPAANRFFPMASLADRLPENASGRYYVDSSCIDCDQCRALAPEFFSRQGETGYSFVARQPESADEMRAVTEILASCPTDSIGNDGAC